MPIQWTMTVGVLGIALCLGSGLSAADARKARSARSHAARGAQQGVADSARRADQGVADSARHADQGIADSATGARNVNEAGISRYEDQPVGTATTTGSSAELFYDNSRINRRTGEAANDQARSARPANAPPLAAPLPAGLVVPTGTASWKLDDLRGRTVLVLFIETMNFADGRELGQLLKKLHERWADDPAVVLIAAKIDPGDAEETARYLARHVDPQAWRVAADPHGLWSHLLCGESRNGNYAIIGPRGELAGTGRALPPEHDHVSTAPEFALAAIDLAHIGESDRPNPAELAELPTPLADALKLAVYGQYDQALAVYGEYATDELLRTDAVTLRQAVMRLAEREVEIQTQALGRADAVSRYHAYRRLGELRRQLGRSDPGLAAAEAMANVAGEPFIRQSLISANHYRTLTHRAAEAEADAPQVLQAGLNDLYQNRPHSYHGHIAGEALKRIEAARAAIVQAP